MSHYESKAKTINGVTTLVHYDKVLNVDWPHNDEVGYQGIAGPGPPLFLCAATGEYASSKDLPNQIQIAPWYLNWVLTQRFKGSTEVKPAWLTSVLPETEQVLARRAKTKMDLRTGLLMDIVLSHEFTHLTYAGYARDYAKSPIYGGQGWNYSVWNAANGDQAAENLAQLGAAARLIQDEDVMPNLVGDIVPLSL